MARGGELLQTVLQPAGHRERERERGPRGASGANRAESGTLPPFSTPAPQ